ncbi:hypothetical protein ACHAL6_00525 [Proteiniclasticum sp. C24MP]|uniref:hypothetical protein n=1 Tax=Proteiniclasticum sp. C24MP TaxID=3374101 RepID=UPI0037548A66
MEHKCSKEGEIAALKENVINLYKKHDAHDKRMEKIENKTDAQYEMAKSIAVMAEKMTTISEDVKEVKADVTALKKEVREKREGALETKINVWEKYKSHIITLIITAVVTYYLLQIGG